MRYESSNDLEQRGHFRDCSVKQPSSGPYLWLVSVQVHAPDHKRMHSKQNSCAHTGMMVLSRNGCKQIVQCSCSSSSSTAPSGIWSFWSFSGGDSDGSSLMRFDDGDAFIPGIISHDLW